MRTRDWVVVGGCLIAALLCCTKIASGKDRLWRVSVATSMGASTADFATSLGHYESNRLLADASGRFSPRRAVVFKVLPQAGLLALQSRNHRRFWTWVNFACAGVFSAAAIHNARTR